ncbi:MAG: DUF2219 family protein [Bacteroidia bacterium]|nr:DUF2219 family protein [Bacteroidia bacterium]
MRTRYALLLWLVPACLVQAQVQEAALWQFPLDSLGQAHLVLRAENDAYQPIQLLRYSDFAYTAGNAVAYLGPGARTSHGAYRRWQVGLAQWIFTPLDLKAETPVPGARPYAGLLLLSGHVAWHGEQRRWQVGLAAGVLGPASGGGATQRFIHRTFGFVRPRGWADELPNTAVAQAYALAEWRLGPGPAWFWASAELGNLWRRAGLGLVAQPWLGAARRWQGALQAGALWVEHQGLLSAEPPTGATTRVPPSAVAPVVGVAELRLARARRDPSRPGLELGFAAQTGEHTADLSFHYRGRLTLLLPLGRATAR